MEMDLTQKTPLITIRKIKAPKSSTKFFIYEDFIVGDWVIPKGFDTDLTSVPWGMRNVVSQLDGIEAAVVHDWLYRTGQVKREKADEVFFELLKCSVPNWKRHIMYWGVRLGGGFSYKG